MKNEVGDFCGFFVFLYNIFVIGCKDIKNYIFRVVGDFFFWIGFN